MTNKESAHIEDKELLQKYYDEGNNKWLGILLERYTMLLLGVCMKYLKNEEQAKDTVQQVFLKVITELPKYKVEYFKSWLYTVAKNLCLMKLRDMHGKYTVEPADNLVASEDYKIKSEVYEKDAALQYVEEGLQQLNPEQQQCVTLFYLNKKSYQEISDLTGFTTMKVKSYIQNGKRNLKHFVEEKMNKANG